MNDPAIDERDVVIIGGGALGMTTATHVRRCSNYSVTVISKDIHTAYSECGIPSVLEGEIDDLDSLIIRTPAFFKEIGIDVILDTEVRNIDLKNRTINTIKKRIGFNKLVIATGSVPNIPPQLSSSAALKNVFTLKTLSDGRRIEHALEEVSRVVIIGAGPIGVELAVAATRRGLDTTLINRSSSVLSHHIDPEMADIVLEHLTSMGIRVITGHSPTAMNGNNRVRSVTIAEQEIPTDVVLISTSASPETSLAREAGIAIGQSGGIIVNDHLQVKVGETFDPDIFAGGDCAQVYDLITGQPLISHLAGTARRMASIIADNICDRPATFGPILRPWICQVGNLLVGSVGLTNAEASSHNINIVTGSCRGQTRAAYYPGTTPIFIKVLFQDRRLVGGQVIAGEGVKERIDALSFAILTEADIEELLTLETCYTPSVSTVVDPLMHALKDARKQMEDAA
ncbi:MAG: FAD-dependent oxidoreductase [Euryarchaeota archaeon]|nr:FAD-dependent oxidoreductase [Euryarchaeota archaeon]